MRDILTNLFSKWPHHNINICIVFVCFNHQVTWTTNIPVPIFGIHVPDGVSPSLGLYLIPSHGEVPLDIA